MKNIITIQHTQAVHHNNGMVGSWTDWELSDLGKEHAKNIGRNLSAELKGQTFKIYSSDLIRAKQTAEPLARYMEMEIEYYQKLREINLGEAVGKTSQWANENPLKDWSENSFDVPQFVDAETWREFWNRVTNFCREIIEDETKNIILVSHGVTLSVWQKVWLGSDIVEFTYSGLPGGVSFMEINDNGEHIIKRLNDSSYMKGK